MAFLNEDTENLDETLFTECSTIKQTIASHTLLNSFRNPFDIKKQGTLSIQKTHEEKKFKDTMEKYPNAKQLSIATSPSNPPSTRDTDHYAYPLVSFPYVISINPELAYGFNLIDNQFPALTCEVKSLEIMLPQLSPTLKTLILGLEGLLVSSNLEEEQKNLEGNWWKDSLIRPNLTEFLSLMSQSFEIIVFSTCTKSETDFLISKIDPEKKYITYSLNRENCIVRENSYCLKDLRIFIGRTLEKTIIIDNNIFAFSGQMENGIYIPSFQGNKDDCELLTVMEFLKTITKEVDARPLVKKFSGLIRLYKLRAQSQLEEIYLNLEEEEEASIGDEYK